LPILLIPDLSLPGMRGFELIERLKREARPTIDKTGAVRWRRSGFVYPALVSSRAIDRERRPRRRRYARRSSNPAMHS